MPRMQEIFLGYVPGVPRYFAVTTDLKVYRSKAHCCWRVRSTVRSWKRSCFGELAQRVCSRRLIGLTMTVSVYMYAVGSGLS